MQLTICQAQGVKINGRKPKIEDFLPDYAKPKKKKPDIKNQEQILTAALGSLANNIKKP